MEKTVLITGATHGIGRETALKLALAGCRVLLHGRTPERAEAAAADIRRLTGNDRVLPVAADLSSMAEVRSLAARVESSFDRIEVLINNAGVFMNERVLTVDGLETTFAVNHLAPFLLTNLLLDLLRRSAPARVVNVSSISHQNARLDLDDLQGERGYSGYEAYAASKLANVLFTVELADRLRGTGVTVNCLHPGVVATKLLRAGFSIPGAPVESGAETPVWLALAPEVETVTGKYFIKRQPQQPSPLALNKGLRRRLWEESARLAGVT